MKPFNCKPCNWSFSSRNPTPTYMDQLKFTCWICDKGFSQKGRLNRHIKQVHLGIKEHQCQLCSKGYHNKNSLNAHLLSHVTSGGEQPFKCNECGKGFETKTGLNKHVRLHFMKNAFSCGECKAEFKTKRDFERHLLTHIGVKNFQCQTCSRSFSRKDNLIRHCRTCRRPELEENSKCFLEITVILTEQEEIGHESINLDGSKFIHACKNLEMIEIELG